VTSQPESAIYREQPGGLKAGRRFTRLPDWRGLAPRFSNLWAAAVYLLLPSLVVSLIYRGPRVVLDPIILLAFEAVLPHWARRMVRAAWIVVCGCVLLMEWNIYSESYLFYSSMLARIVFTPHGFGILCALIFMLGFMALPAKIMKPNPALLLLGVALYGVVMLVKGPAWGPQTPVWLRAPFGRSVQAMI